MRRAGVVLLTTDGSATAFLDDVLDEIAPEDAPVIEVSCARAALAAVTSSARRRLLVVDGAPPDRTAGALIEALRVVDPDLPIVLVRYGWPGPATVHERVHVVPGPLQGLAVQALLVTLIGGAA